MKFLPVKTRVVNPPKDEIWDIVDDLDAQDGDIIFITSKILGIHQGRTEKIGAIDKTDLIKREATHYLEYVHPFGVGVNLTITNNILICAAGIDESNGNGFYVLYPREIDKLCREIRARICKRRGIRNLGIIATDSHTVPLRWGVVGITVGLAGVKPLRDMRGHDDIFGRKIKMTQINTVDPIAAMAVRVMGETDERVPVVILRDYADIDFDANAGMDDMTISPELDIYNPLLSVFNVIK